MNVSGWRPLKQIFRDTMSAASSSSSASADGDGAVVKRRRVDEGGASPAAAVLTAEEYRLKIRTMLQHSSREVLLDTLASMCVGCARRGCAAFPQKVRYCQSAPVSTPFFCLGSLISFARRRGSMYQPVYDEITRVANADEGNRKLFIHKVDPELTSEQLKASFEAAFGEVESAMVILDKATGKAKGFAFLVFKHIDSALAAIAKGDIPIEVRRCRSMRFFRRSRWGGAADGSG